jgi:hypothetical protein
LVKGAYVSRRHNDGSIDSRYLRQIFASNRCEASRHHLGLPQEYPYPARVKFALFDAKTVSKLAPRPGEDVGRRVVRGLTFVESSEIESNVERPE